MIVSLVNVSYRGFFVIGGAVVGGWLVIANAMAQSEPVTSEPTLIEPPASLSAPIDLSPPGSALKRAAGAASDGQSEAAPLAPPEGAVPAFGGVSAGEAVQVQTLRAIGADSSGTLTEGQGGFGDGMWRGSDLAVIEALIERIGQPTGPAVAGLTRRLLLSSASVPSGDGKAGDFLEVRVRALARAGRMAEIDTLVSGLSPSLKTAVTRRIEADAVLLSGDDARACGLAAAEITETDIAAGSDPYWTLILAYCQILGGQSTEADLAISLLQETDEIPATFAQVFVALRASQPVNISDLSSVSALELAMVRTAGIRASSGLSLPNTPAFWPAIARLEGLPDHVRAGALEAALSLDLLSSDDANALAESFVFDPTLTNSALTGVDDLSPALGRVLLFQAASAQPVATARAELIAKALQTAERDGASIGASRLFFPLIQKLPGSSELVWFADFGLRAAIAAGRSDGAARWLQMMTAGAVFRPEMKTSLGLILPRARLARVPGSDRWKRDSFAEWQVAREQANPDADPATRQSNQVWMLSALTALGETITASDWTLALNDTVPAGETETGGRPSSGVETILMAAGMNQRIGETVVAALAIMTETRGSPGAASSFALARALSEAGLDRDARDLLLDVAMSKGL